MADEFADQQFVTGSKRWDAGSDDAKLDFEAGKILAFIGGNHWGITHVRQYQLSIPPSVKNY